MMVSATVPLVCLVSCLAFVSSSTIGDFLTIARKFKRNLELRVLPAYQEPTMRQAFASFDSDGSGLISSTEMRNALAAQGQTISEGMMSMMMPQFDKNGDGVVDFSEYLAMQGYRQAGASGSSQNTQQNEAHLPDRNEEGYHAFMSFDQDRSGFVTQNEMKTAMAAMGQNLPDWQLAYMVQQTDKNGDGKVDFSEFQARMGSQ